MTRERATWTADQLPSFAGRTVVITGANSGLGLRTAHVLAGAGAHVVLAVRDPDKGRRAADLIPGKTEVRELDLASLASIREFAGSWQGGIDVLLNNAGVMMPPLGRTIDGFERQFGTNHLGAFALTVLLLPHITDRVISMSSTAHRNATIEFDDLNWNTRTYSAAGAYGQSKLANLLFVLELERRLRLSGSPVRAVAAHPGYASTNITSSIGNPLARAATWFTDRIVAQSVENGALPALFAASEEIPGGSFVGPSGRGELKGEPTLVGRAFQAADARAAVRLWEESERLTGTTFSSPKPRAV